MFPRRKMVLGDLLEQNKKGLLQAGNYANEVKMGKKKMLTGFGTWLKLQTDSEFNTFFEGLKEYLRSKLQLVNV